MKTNGDPINDGEEIWSKLVSRHSNMKLVLSGHVLREGVAYLKSIGNHGNAVHQILSNFQMLDHGGNGFLRIMKFTEDGNSVAIKTYSPVLNEYMDDPLNDFTIEL